MKRYFLTLAFLAVLLGGASSCRHWPIDPGDPSDTTYTPITHPLSGTSWELVGISVNGDRMQKPVNEIFTLKFDKGMQAGGQASCNSYGADVKADMENISFSNMITTQAECGDLSLDKLFMQGLGPAKSYTDNGFGSLVIFTTTGINMYFHDMNYKQPQDTSNVVRFADFQAVDFKVDPFHITNIKKIDDMHIAITVEYSGGCTEHDFALYADENIMPGNATDFAQMMVTHNAHGDMCEAWITKELVFNVAPLLRKWKAYPYSNDRLALQFSQSDISTIIFTK